MLHQFAEKIKGLGGAYFLSFIVFLTVVAGVGVWRIFMARQAKFEPILAPNAFDVRFDRQSGGSFIASKNGEVYYPKACASVGRIRPENRLFFASALEAEGAGFRRGTQCK